jgi:hypothetical protein
MQASGNVGVVAYVATVFGGMNVTAVGCPAYVVTEMVN